MCACSTSGVCQGLLCLFCAVKLNIQNGRRKHSKSQKEKKSTTKIIMCRTFYKTNLIFTSFGPNFWFKSTGKLYCGYLCGVICDRISQSVDGIIKWTKGKERICVF